MYSIVRPWSLLLSLIAIVVFSPAAFAQTATDVNCSKCVDASDLAKKSVGSGKLKSDAVSTNKIKDGAVTARKLADGAVTADKLAPGVGGGWGGYRVRDSQGNVIGEMSAAEAFIVRTNSSVIPVAVSTPETNNEKVVVAIIKGRFTNARPVVARYYLDDQCAGTAYVAHVQSDPSFKTDLFPASDQYFFGYTSDPDLVYSIYEIVDPFYTEEGEPSYWMNGTNCQQYTSFSISLGTLNPVLTDLQAIFPPPYTLEFY